VADYPLLVILAGFVPDAGAGGGALLRSLLDDYPADRLIWIDINGIKNQNCWWRPSIRRLSIPHFIPRRGLQFSLSRPFWIYLGNPFQSYCASKYILKIIKALKPDLCWAILDFDVICTIKNVIQNTQIPFHVSVHDDPLIAAEITNYPILNRKLKNNFSYCYSNAASRDCISDRMAAEYSERYHRESIVVTRAVDDEKAISIKAEIDPSNENCIKIVMTGDTWSEKKWIDQILGSIDILEKKIQKKAEFHIFGNPSFASPDKRIIVHNFLPEKEFDVSLSKMTIGFANDPITELGKQFAGTSIPTKIITYIGAGVPFLYQGPKDSTVADLLSKYNAGLIVESNNPEDLASGFNEILSTYKEKRHECYRAVNEVFRRSIILNRLMSQFSLDCNSNHRK
jgi:hypothetical protein